MVATFLMIYEVGLFGTLSGLFASFLLPTQAESLEDTKSLRKEIQVLKGLIKNTKNAA